MHPHRRVHLVVEGMPGLMVGEKRKKLRAITCPEVLVSCASQDHLIRADPPALHLR